MKQKTDYTHIDSMTLLGKADHGMCCQAVVLASFERMAALIGAIHNEIEALAEDDPEAVQAVRLMEILAAMTFELQPKVSEAFYSFDVMRADLKQLSTAG